jgi:hypothetical protein
MTGITSIIRNPSLGQLVYVVSSDTLATVSGSGYITAQQAAINALNNGVWNWTSQDVLLVAASDGNQLYEFTDGTFSSLVVLGSLGASGPMVNATTTASATPGTLRSITGKVSNTATTMTSGNIVGVRGEADLVSASGGFVYGVEGKVIPTGTLSGSVWAPAVFGQYDLSNATLNAGQIAAIWGDMGTSGGTFTNVTGARMFAGTNTISTLTLNSMIYLYGQATNLFELSGSNSTYISTASGTTPSGDLKKLAITIDGVTHYILAAAVWS